MLVTAAPGALCEPLGAPGAPPLGLQGLPGAPRVFTGRARGAFNVANGLIKYPPLEFKTDLPSAAILDFINMF